MPISWDPERDDPFETGNWPFGPLSHDVGWRWMFDLAVVGGLLGCRPGDEVLDLGAGSGFSTEMLVRFGYRVTALDPDTRALVQARRRLGLDRRLRSELGRMVTGIAEALPFADAVFDGVAGMNVVHHVDDQVAAMRDLARVLKPGGRAAFSEPGTRHLEMPETARARREHGEDDKAFDVRELGAIAKANGFSRVELAPLPYPFLVPVEIGELDAYVRGEHPVPLTRPATVAQHLIESHPVFVLVRDGERAKDSRRPAALRADLAIGDRPAAVRAGDTFEVSVTARNTGDTRWLAGPPFAIGYVSVGCKLLAEDGRLVDDRLGRTPIARDVAPGESVAARLAVTIPTTLAPGRYGLAVDLVDEWICWFSDATVEAPPVHQLVVES